MLLAAPHLIEKALPRVDRVLDVTNPIASANGWVIPRRGYNSDLRVLLDADYQLREMPLDDAKQIMAEITRDFPFADE